MKQAFFLFRFLRLYNSQYRKVYIVVVVRYSMKKHNLKEEKILQVLEKLQTVPTSRIANEIKSNYFNTITHLENLLKQNKVRRLTQGKYVYWELK